MYRFYLWLDYIALLAVVVIRLILKSMDQHLYDKPIFIPLIIRNIFIATIFLRASIAIKYFRQRIRHTERIDELTSTGLRSEC